MTKYNNTCWIFWILLVLGLFLLGACGESGPTTPEDVQELSEGGDIEETQLSDLVTAYEALVAAGGGVEVVPDVEDFGLVACRDRWSGEAVTAVVFIETDTGELLTLSVNGTKLLSGLVFPITLTAFADGYVSQTILATNANLVVFAMEPYAMSGGRVCMVVAIADSPAVGAGNDLWRLKGTTTHVPAQWNETTGGPYALQHIYMNANAYQNVGAVLFMYSAEITTDMIGTGEGDPLEFDILGYAYQDFGSLPATATIGWMFEFPETPTAPNTYTSGNFAIDASLFGEGTALVTTPGGCIGNSWEFVPYGLQVYVIPEAATGTYDLEAFDPPLTPDRHVVEASIKYPTGGRETMYVAWDPSGAGLPDLNFGIPPVIDTAEIDMFNFLINADWTNGTTAGLLTLDIYGRDGSLVWQIHLAHDAAGLPVDEMNIPGYSLYMLGYEPRVMLARIECAGISIDGYDYETIWSTTTSFLNSPQFLCDLPIPDPEPTH